MNEDLKTTKFQLQKPEKDQIKLSMQKEGNKE